jgi:CRP/FNR family transcriptional regulator, cyclic AMP receptor protein
MPATISDATIAKCPLFRGMSAAERQELVALLDGKLYSPKSIILEEGESFQHIFIILKGRCQVVKKSKSGEERELWVLEPCGVFGEMSFFNPAPHSASVRALSEVEVLRLPREKYDQLLRGGSLAAYKLAFNTMGVLIERLRRMDDWIADHMERNNTSAHKEEWMDFQSKLYTGWTF